MGRELAALYERYVEFLKLPFVKDIAEYADEQVNETDRIWDNLKPEAKIGKEQVRRKWFEELAYGVLFKRAYDRKHRAIRRAWEQEATRRSDIINARGL